MNNILTALATKISSSTLYSTLSGRIWLDTYQGDSPTTFPYCVYSIVSSILEKTFADEMRNTLIQFSLYSSSSSVAEITGLYNDLKTLLDESSLSITSNKSISIEEVNLVTSTENITTIDGSQEIRAWHVDYEFKTSVG